MQGHHVISQQQLRNHGYPDEQYMWDPRNGMGLCYRHHRRHDNATERIPYAFLSSANINFARELGLDWLLEKHYPRYMPGDENGRDGLHDTDH